MATNHIGRCGHTASTTREINMNVWIRWNAGGASAPSRRVATVIRSPAMPVGVGFGTSDILGHFLDESNHGLIGVKCDWFDYDQVIHRC